MKFTMTSVFVAALAAVSSAAVAGEAPLPAKFTLKATTPTKGTVLEGYLGQVTVDSYGSQFLNIGTSGQDQIPVTIYKIGDSSAYVENMADLGNWNLTITPTGDVRFWGNTIHMDDWLGTGFTQLNKALAFNAADGKGPRSLWTACTDKFNFHHWTVHWTPSTTLSGCIPIGLTVVPL